MSTFTAMDDSGCDGGDLLSTELFAAVTANINHLIDCAKPGKIVAILYGLTGVPVPDPSFFQLCDGSAVTDPLSPLFGTTTPDLVSAMIIINSLIYKAKITSTVTITYVDKIPAVPAVAAAKTIQTVHYVADTAGTGGNSITIQIVIDRDPSTGTEDVVVSGNAIKVRLFNYGGTGSPKTLTTAATVVSLVNGYGPSAALVTAALTDAGATVMNAQAPTALTGGVAIIPAIGTAGNEVVSVSGNDITVRLESGVSTIQQIKTAIQASVAASALVEMIINSGTGTITQTAPMAAHALTPGIYLKGAASTGTSGFTGGANSKNLSHSHGGATGTMNALERGDTDDDFFTTVNHTHPIAAALTSVINFEPAHFKIRHYIKIR